MRFEKWQALGNDYVIVEHDELPWPLTQERIRRLCAPHTGIGSDGVLLISEADDEHCVARVRIFNPDGSEAELSGNGVRQAVMYLRRSGTAEDERFAIQTAAGTVEARITGPTECATDIGRASTTSPDYPGGAPDGRGELQLDGGPVAFQHVSVGNPQCAIALASLGELEGLNLVKLGPPIERHELFPNRTNVSWYCELEPGVIRARIFERGVGETLSSGTGASGAAVAYHLGGGPSAVAVRLDGGELGVNLGDDLGVTLSGWAVPVYSGELSSELEAELDAAE